jgi:hypothetical protein
VRVLGARCLALASVGAFAVAGAALRELRHFRALWELADCGALETVAFAAVRVVGAAAFRASALRSAAFPASLREVHAGTFENCAMLSCVTFDDAARLERRSPRSRFGRSTSAGSSLGRPSSRSPRSRCSSSSGCADR